MPSLRGALKDLVRIPSISVPGRIDTSLVDAHDMTAALFSDAGVQVNRLDLPDTAPVVTGHIPAPTGAPTVLLYGHYDVVGAGDESEWDTSPFEPVERDGAIYGRGTADSKANVIAHLGALRTWDGRPPVGIKLCIEGQEETGSGALLERLLEDPELFKADAIVINDLGSVAPGVPTLTTALRGTATVFVQARTMRAPRHSGQYGGAAPDALLALITGLSTLHDARGDVAVPGLRRSEWAEPVQSLEAFRILSRALPDVPLIGSGTLESRIWSGPSITIVGIDAPPVDRAVSAVASYARAVLDVRTHPEQDIAEAQRRVTEHLAAARPLGVQLEVSPGPIGNGFSADTSGPAYTAARASWSKAWQAGVIMAGCGGSVPIVATLAAGLPEAEVLLVGAADGQAQIHGPNERVMLTEFERTIIAEAEFFNRYVATYERSPLRAKRTL
jgi:cysteinylglycine-S-conjugate dipeptidase